MGIQNRFKDYIVPIAIGTVLAAGVAVSPKNTWAADEPVSTVGGALYYSIGAGNVIPRPATGYVTHAVSANIKANLGYSCGKFDPTNNVVDTFNRIKSQIQDLPAQLGQALNAYVASLPSYLLHKANSALYNVVTKGIDESFELYSFSYKTCKTVEREISDGVENPYAGFMRAAVAQRWSTADADDNINDLNDSINENPGGSGVKIGNVNYGGDGQPTFWINELISIAGYNSLIDRRPWDDQNVAPAAVQDDFMVTIWPDPNDAASWIVGVVGDTGLRSAPEDYKPETMIPRGLEANLAAMITLVEEAWIAVLNQNDYSKIRAFSAVKTPSVLIDAVKQADPGEAAIMISKLSEEMAMSEIQARVMLAKRLLYAGLQDSEISASNLGGFADKYVREKTLSSLDDSLNSLLEDYKYKKLATNETAKKILDYEFQKRLDAIKSPPSKLQSVRPIVDGGVAQ